MSEHRKMNGGKITGSSDPREINLTQKQSAFGQSENKTKKKQHPMPNDSNLHGRNKRAI